jgi:hypothetical protein
MLSSKAGLRRRVSRRRESWRGICLVEVGEVAACGRIWAASWRRAERVWMLEEWERRVVRREVKEVVRVWVAGGRAG